MRNQTSTIKRDLQQIAEILLLNGTLIVCPGLVHGKMGIALFFFHYARYTDNPLFADYALEIIGEMQNQIHINSPADYEKGIAGIGVGIDYLIQNDFLDAEEDIFEDMDRRMVRAVLNDPWPDFSLYDGLTGYGRYWISHLRRQPFSGEAQECLSYITKQIEEKWADIPQKEQTDSYCFLQDLKEIPGLDISTRLLEHYRKWSTDMNRNSPRLADPTAPIPELNREKQPVAMGLLTGYAGEGLLRLTALDPTHSSWTSLL